MKNAVRLILALASSCLMVGNAQADLDDGLVACYPFEGDANDQSGNGHDGIIDGAILASDRSDNENSAYYFNGNHQEIVVPTKPITDQLTYLVWFKINSFSPDHATTILHRQEGTADNHETIRIESNTRKLAFYLITENGHRGLAYGNFENRKNEWIHIVATYDGKVMKLFDNGVLVAERDFGDVASLKRNSTPFTIGGERDNGSPVASFNGFIDDVFIYERAISESEVQALYLGNSPCEEKELLVELESLIATPFQNDIRIHWKTASELDNAGFHIWRATGEGWKQGDYSQVIRITDPLIPSKGTKVGGYPYSYIDSNVESGITYYYGLEDIDSKGQSTVHWDFIDEITAK